MTNIHFDEKSDIKNFVADGYLPTDQWKATDVNGHLLIATQNTQDLKDMHLYNMPGVTIIRNYVKTENTWIREDPFPEETAGNKALTGDEVIKFIVDGLGIELEAWQEELLRQRVHGERALRIQPKGR